MQRDRSVAAIRRYWRQLEFSVRTAYAQRAVETVRFRLLQGDTQYMKTFHKRFHRASLGSLLAAGGAAVLLTILLATPAYAASDLNTVIDSVRNWVAGLLAALATLFLNIGGARYLTVNGNPWAVLDCFAGSGATLVAARGLGFRAIGIERDRSYLPALIRRVRQSVGLQLERAA